MKFEYLIFNLIVISGPLLLSFDRKVAFFKKWPQVFTAIGIAMIPFITWDALVTGRHWWFNEKYVLGINIFGLPLEECLFFVTVPFSSLFVWEVLGAYFSNKTMRSMRWVGYGFMAGIPAGVALFFLGKEYTGLVAIGLGLVAILDQVLKTHILRQSRILSYSAILTGLMLIFNGFLTARPVVRYDYAYQLKVLIHTIPLEDFFYGYMLIFLCTILYQKFTRTSKNR